MSDTSNIPPDGFSYGKNGELIVNGLPPSTAWGFSRRRRRARGEGVYLFRFDIGKLILNIAIGLFALCLVLLGIGFVNYLWG